MADARDARLWGARFSGSAAAAFDALNVSFDVDQRLWREDIAGSRAHARMLGRQGILPTADVDAILTGLDAVEREFADGTFGATPTDEDIHTAVERRLTELVGDAGRRLHTGRSRNDQVITDTLLYLRRRGEAQLDLVARLADALVAQSERHVDTIMPGYTHGQRAQPIRLAHHLLAYVWMLARDRRRLAFAIESAEECPLGSGALSGSGFPLDRVSVAEELGFARPTANSLDAVGSRDALVDYLAFASQLGVHLSRLGAEIVWWSTDEVGFVTLSDAFTSGSSMLPQKKNPDAAELARAKAPRLAADLSGLLGTLIGLPLAYNKDLQEDKPYLFDAIDTVEALLPAVTGMLAEARFHPERMEAACEGGYLAATDLADHLVATGVPFRSAHAAVGLLVRECMAAGRALADATERELTAAGLPGLILPPLDARSCVERKDVQGGTARARVVSQLAEARALVSSW